MFYKGKHDREKQLRFSIRKVSFGVASVVIAAFMMFIGGGTVQADAIQSNDSSSASVSSNHQPKDSDKKTDNEDRVNTSNLKESEATFENTEPKDVISSTESFNNESRQEEKQFIKADTSKLELAVARVQALLEKTEVNEKTEEVIKSANEELAKAQDLLSNAKVIQGDIDKELSSLNNIDFILKSIPKASIEKKLEKENKNQDPRNGKAIPGKGESGFREAVSNSANTISKAIEGPTNNNKLGYGNNPQNGVFESAKEQFGDINFDDAVVKEKKIEKQWSKSILSDKTGKSKTQLLTGGITYKWKEKEINGSLNGWKITDSSGASTILKAIKPEQPVADTGREKEYLGTPSKVYDNDNSITRNYNENEGPNQPLGVHASNQNYANGVNYSGTVGTHNLPKGYYLELGKQGNKISKEYSVNSNSRVILSAITGGAYGNMGTAGTGEKIKISVYDAQNNSLIPSVRDDRTEGEKYETSHISTPTGNGGNGDGWTEYRAIYEIPLNTTRIRVEIEALHDGSALKGDPITGKTSYSLNNGKKQLEDGYFVGAVNLALGTGTEMTTNVKTNNQEGGYGENKLYKSEQKGELEFTVNSVGGIRHYGSAKTEIEIPEGVELPDNIKNAKDTVWFGGVPISPKNIVYDSISRKLTLIYNTSANNAGKDPRIGVGSNNGTRNFKIPFTTTSNYKGTATFKIRTFLPNGLRDSDDNVLLNTGDVSNSNGLYHNTVSGVRNSENPNYYYNKTIYIDSTKPKAPTVETIHTDGVQGNSTNKNQERNLLISIPEEETGLTDPVREKKDVIENDKNNNNKDNQHKLAEAEATTEVEKINHAIGGVTSITVTLPNGAKTIKLTKKGDEWYKDSEKLKKVDGKLVLPLPEDINLDEANNALSPDKRIKVTVQDKAGNDSDVAYANVLNEAPTLNVNKDVIYVPKTDVSNKVNTEKLLKQVSDTIVDGKPGIEVADLEDDRDNKETTKPNVSVIDDQGLDTSKPGVYTVTLKATDSEGKDSVEKNDDTDKFDVVVVEGIPQIVPVSDNNIQPDVLKNIDKSQFPDDATFEYKEEVNTSEAGDKNVTVVVKDKAGNKLVEVPATVRVVESYPQYVPVNKEGISPKDSIDPSKFPEGTTFEYKEKPNTGSTGDKDVTVVAKLGTEIVAEIPAKIVVVDSKTQYVAENKENTQPDASKSVDEENYPEGSKFKFKEPVETSKAGDKETTVVVTDKDGNPLVEVPATVVVAKGYPQIVPVSEGNEQPSVKDSIDSDQYPEGSTFEYKEEVNTSEAGDKNVTVVVKDKAGNKLVEVPATVRVVESYPQYVPVNKEGISPKDSIDPSKFPEGTTFEYKEKPNTGSTGDKDVTVVAKLGTEIVAEIPAKIVVVDSKTQYVAENKENTQPDASKSVDEENYPEGSKFKFKEPVETSKAGDKETTVVVTDKDGNPLVEVPATVVVAKGYPQIVPVSEGNEQPSVKDSIDSDQYPEGSTFEYKEEVNTSEAGDKNVTVVVKDKAGNKLVEVPATVRVVESYPQYVPVNKEGISPKDSIDPSKFPEGTTFEYKEKPNTGSTGDKDVTVVAKLGTEIVAEIPAKIVVVDSKTQYVAENKENTQPDASKSVDEENYPEGSKFKFKEPVETSKAGDKETTVVVTDKDGNPLVEVPATVVVAKGYPQIVPVSEGNEQPSVKDSIDSDQYPEGSTFEYKEEVNTSEAGDKNVTVVVKDKAGNKLVEVPATVRVVESYPQYVPVNKEGISPKDSIDPSKFPEGTTFEYKEKPNTGSTGDKDVTVVAKLGTEIVAEIPAKIVVVDSKTQYVPVDKSNKQPDASKNIDPEQYPDGVTFKYKTPVDTTTPGEKDVIVEAKDGEDKLVEVPAKVKVVEGKEQLIPVNPTEKPQARDSITPSDYPEGSTFEYKVPDGQTEPFDATTVGDKPVTVVVKDRNGNVLVEVPATIKVVEAKPRPIETPVTNTPLTKDDIAKYVKVPEGGKVTNVENVPDLTTPGKKNPVKVTVTLPNGKTTTVEVPVNVTPVKGIETPVTKTPLIPDDYTKGITIPEGGKVTNVENIPDLTTPGKKDPVKVTVELPNGKTITVDVPVNVTPVKGIETPVTNTPLTPEDYTKGITIPEGGKVTNVENVPDLTTPGKKTPVKVTVELPNGKTITVDIPVNVTPVKGIETPVTNTPLTPEDYTKGIAIPEGGKVTNVENIPDLTTPGKKTPVKVTVELPNGKTITVDIPVNVTPVKGIETPVTNTPLTPENYTKGITIPEGGKVTNVENVPDLTTPGKKTPVKVTVELPNGKTITVEVPVNVTPVKGIETPVKGIETPVTNTPLTPEDYTKGITIPEGGKVTNVENIPDLTTPGKKEPVKVTVELPNGKTITVEVPVNVTPVKGIETPVTNTPLTPENYTKGITIPEGGKVTNVENVPDLTTPGKKTPVKVTVELPNGKTITVDIPVNVTPVKGIETPVTNTPLTPEDYTKGIAIPEGGKVTNVENIPDLTTPGKKTPVKVTVELPNGKTITVDIPVNVTPVKGIETPVTNTPLTPEDYTKGIAIPEGGKVTNVENIPDLTTPGKKTPVKVTVELPNGKTITVDIPVNVTPVKGIETPVTNTPLTPENYTKGITIPEGGKVTNVENVPDLTTPGKKTPVKVTVELPNGKTITVEVPVNVTPVKGIETPVKGIETPVKGIETPVTNTPLTPEDYTKGITIPEGGKVTNVENIPDLTTPGKKEPVKVTVELPNGKTITVDVPVNVTPVKGIETPVTNTPLTPENYTKGITIPEGGKVTNVENVPDLTTPGKKTPVKVTVELPNGKTITVDIPVNVTPVKGIETPVTNTPLTPEDYTKGIAIPEGGKVTNVENIPDLTTPGKKTPVKVTVELPNGKTITVDIPVNVTPVKGIETPVTNTPLTPENYTKGITIPEGGKVTNVENVPDLTTPGKKTPVKVTVELPNGKTITVEVPVNVTPVKGIETPVKGIETPVTNTPLTPEDYTKGITIPEGGKVTNVENIPDLTTPGKKEPVKVTVELPNGKTITVEVPVNVTPVKGIETPVTNTPLTPEDYTKGITIPEGGKVTNVENIPDLTTPGKKDPVKVTVELPNGKTITVEVPVNVTPATGIETPVTDTPLTPEDIEKHVKVPEGGKIIGVGEIPKVNTPGDKGTVKVKIELPNGKQIEVEVPVKVTPIKDIVKKLGDPITNDDVEKHIQIPEGGKIISIGDKPSTDVPGERPSVPVVIELPGGKRVTVKVPVIVTPKTTPVVVEVGTPITEDMVKKHVDLPEGWKITKVGEIPKTNTPGDKPSVTVEIELPDGRKVTVEVPVKVTPKSNHGNSHGNNGSSTTHIVTRYQDGDGKEISPEENGSHGPKTLEGYEYTGTKTDKNGNVIHIYKKVVTPTRSEQPSSPETPTSPEKPVAVETTVANDKKELPNTGTEDKAGLASLGLLGMLSAFGLVARKKKED